MDDEENAVRALREAGKTWPVVAETLGGDRSELYERYKDSDWNQPIRAAYNTSLEKRRAELRAEKLRVPDEDITRAMREAGKSWPQIAKQYGTRPSLIHERYKDCDWNREAPRRTRTARKMNGKPRSRLADLVADPAAIAMFWSWVDKDGPVQSDLGPCWIWMFTKALGYGSFRYRGRSRPAHRIAYRLTKGPIHFPHVDHVCHSHDPGCWGGPHCPHRACVNPDHLESVPARENIHRAAFTVRRDAGAACAEGHAWSAESTLFDVRGLRVCRVCVIADATK